MTRLAIGLLALCSCTTEVIDASATTTGATPQTSALFCPDQPVARVDMARYLERLKRGADFVPPPPVNLFADVPPSSVDAAWIEQLFADGITRGSGGNRFLPDDSVPREQMAAFIIRLTHGRDFYRAGPSRFTDVDNPDFIGYIEQLADDGITKGCTETEFCPHDLVTRAQMAAFLMRAAHPGSTDPAGQGVFADVADGVLAGRIEQAVGERIMEPCGRLVGGRPDFGLGNPDLPGHGTQDAPPAAILSIPRTTSSEWIFGTTRWDGSPWTPALCPDFNPFEADLWFEVTKSDDSGVDIGQAVIAMRPDGDGYGMVGPSLIAWDTQQHRAESINWRGIDRLYNPSYITFDIDTHFTGPSLAMWTKLGGADMIDNGHCGAFWNVLAVIE